MARVKPYANVVLGEGGLGSGVGMLKRRHRYQIRNNNRRFPEITGEDNLTVFSYSGRVKSPEWRWQRRRADLRHFEIFRHGPITIYTRLPARGTYYPICTFPASNECLFGISDAFSAFCLRVSVILPTCSMYPQQKRAYSALHPQAWTYIYIYTGPRPKALTECSPLNFRRSSIENKIKTNKQLTWPKFRPARSFGWADGRDCVDRNEAYTALDRHRKTGTVLDHRHFAGYRPRTL